MLLVSEVLLIFPCPENQPGSGFPYFFWIQSSVQSSVLCLLLLQRISRSCHNVRSSVSTSIVVADNWSQLSQCPVQCFYVYCCFIELVVPSKISSLVFLRLLLLQRIGRSCHYVLSSVSTSIVVSESRSYLPKCPVQYFYVYCCFRELVIAFTMSGLVFLRILLLQRISRRCHNVLSSVSTSTFVSESWSQLSQCAVQCFYVYCCFRELVVPSKMPSLVFLRLLLFQRIGCSFHNVRSSVSTSLIVAENQSQMSQCLIQCFYVYFCCRELVVDVTMCCLVLLSLMLLQRISRGCNNVPSSAFTPIVVAEYRS